MKITFDDCYLITGSNDGTLVIWIILNNRGKCLLLHTSGTASGDLNNKIRITLTLTLLHYFL